MIRKNKSKHYRKNESVDYWLSSTDILSALLLVILLVVLLLMLYLVQVPDEELVDATEGDHYNTEAEYGHRYEIDNEENTSTENGDYDNTAGGGDGGGDGEDDYEEDPELLYPEEGIGDYSGKCAVYVAVADEETDTTIKEKGLRFELYSAYGGLKTLYTYYPVKKEYKLFETTASGTFYFPEKLELGQYELHELTVPKGYDIPDHTAFTLEESLDWSEAYTVTVRLSPSKNIIKLSVKDSGTKKALSGASFDVLAAEDIKTGDGTVRYQKDQVVDHITTDAKGYGESKKLYLGKYLLRQTDVPQYYAGLSDNVSVTVEQKSKDTKSRTESIELVKTSAAIRLVDELYEDQPLEGVKFRITSDNGSKEATKAETDENGEISLTDLNKNTTYRVHQNAAKEGYEPAQDLEFHVDKNGLIDNDSFASYTMTNRTIRISVGVYDRIFRNSLPDVTITLYDKDGNMQETWNANGAAKIISGLEPGDYYLLVNGKEDSRVDVTVENKADLQNVALYMIRSTSIALLAGGVAAAVILLVLIIKLFSKKKKGKQESGE